MTMKATRQQLKDFAKPLISLCTVFLMAISHLEKINLALKK